MRSKIQLLAALSAMLSLSALCATGAGASREDNKVRGTLTAVNTTAATVTVDGSTFTVSEGTVVKIDDTRGTLAQLVPLVGQQAKVEFLRTNPTVATEVDVETAAGNDNGGDANDDNEAKLVGVVTAVSATSISVRPAVGAGVTLAVNAATQVEVDDADCETLAQVPVGSQVNVEFNPATMTATEIKVLVPLAADSGNPAGVNPATQTLTLRAGRRLASFKLMPGTQVTLGNQLLSVRQLRSDDVLRVGYYVVRGQKVTPKISVFRRRP